MICTQCYDLKRKYPLSLVKDICLLCGTSQQMKHTGVKEEDNFYTVDTSFYSDKIVFDKHKRCLEYLQNRDCTVEK